MAFCSKCGAQLPENVKFCPQCGNPLYTEKRKTSEKGAFDSVVNAFTDAKDSTAEFDKNDIEQNKAMALLSYLSWLVLVPILAAKNSPFAKFHANQGLVLAIAELIWLAASSIIRGIFKAIFYHALDLFGLYHFLSVILGLGNLVFLIYSIIGIVNAVNGQAKELPVIGKYKVLK